MIRLVVGKSSFCKNLCKIALHSEFCRNGVDFSGAQSDVLRLYFSFISALLKQPSGRKAVYSESNKLFVKRHPKSRSCKDCRQGVYGNRNYQSQASLSHVSAANEDRRQRQHNNHRTRNKQPFQRLLNAKGNKLFAFKFKIFSLLLNVDKSMTLLNAE